MRLNARSRRLPTPWPVLLCLFALICLPALAQDEPALEPVAPAEPAEDKAEDLGPMSLEIDLQRLLFESRGSNTQDPVWRLSPSPGKRILLLPFTVDNVHRVNKLSRFPISVRTGRFIGFVIPKTDATNRSTDSIDLTQVIRAAPEALQEMLFDRADNDKPSDQPTNNSPSEDEAEPTPESAPRLAREITLHPDGTVRWPMERAIRGAELQSASERNPYAYKIDPQQLREAAPQKGERLTRKDGEDSREYALRKREHQLAEREKQNAYRELRDGLRKLPESFSEPRPTVLYAALEVPAGDTVSFQGPSPLPWTLDADKKKLLEELSRGTAAFQEAEGKDLAGKVVTMIKDHPLDARAIALATMRSKLAGQVKTDDPGYEVITRLLQSNDVPTRRIALVGVATVTPPTLASARLIGVAGEAALGEERKMLSFASLSKLFSTQADDPDNARTLIDRVSQAITDPEGPSAPRVIEKVLESLSAGQANVRQELDEAALDVMVKSLDLSGVTPDEVAGVVTTIIERAPTRPVAAGWLDRQLLGSPDHEVINQTLSQLYEAKVMPPQTDDPTTPGPDPATPEPTQEAGQLVLSGTIPMTRQDHALLRLFDSDDDLQQAAAWAVLGRFHLALPKQEPATEPEATEDAPEDPTLVLFDAVLDKADTRDKMPASVVAFIVNQKDPVLQKVANDRFVALLADPAMSEKASRAALAAYLATPERYSQTIAEYSSEAKRRLLETTYRAQGQEPPLMAGMVADKGETLRWFTGLVKEQGKLPTNGDWTAFALSRGEGSLLQNAGSADTTLAVAAAAALVVSAGGDERQEQAFAQNVALMEARTPQEVKKQWEQQRGKIFADAYKRAQGAYVLVVTLRQADTPGSDDQTPKPVKRIELGLVELQAEGLELSLSLKTVEVSAAPGRLAIQIDKPTSLRSFDTPELSKIAPDHLSQPIALLPQEGGAWSGEQSIPGGQILGVSLEPAN